MAWGNSQQRTAVILYLGTAMLAMPAMLSAFIPLWTAFTVGLALLFIALAITNRKKMKVKS
jgi:predicted membrane protein